MEELIKPNMKQIILFCGTNNLPSKEEHEYIINNINVAFSGLIPRRDIFNQKATKVNENLKNLCKEENIAFISHYEIITRYILIVAVFI